MKLRTFIIVLTAIICLLAIPAVAMQFTDEVNWSLMDFIVAALFLSVFAATMLYIHRKTKSKKRRILYYVASVLIFLAIWVELAVGLIENLWY